MLIFYHSLAIFPILSRLMARREDRVRMRDALASSRMGCTRLMGSYGLNAINAVVLMYFVGFVNLMFLQMEVIQA